MLSDIMCLCKIDTCFKLKRGGYTMSIITIFTVMLDFAVKLFTLGALILAIKALKIYIDKN